MSIVLSCPSCTTRYRANPNAIGTNGRRVRCASCGHVWTAEVEDPSDLPSLQPAPPVTPEAPAEEAGAEKKVHTAFRERQEKKRRTLSAAAAGGAWGGLVTACAVLFVCAWIFRVDIVTLWPRASSAYAAVGTSVNPWGYDVGELDVTREVDHGVPLLVVTGDVHNFDRRARAIPSLRAILRDAQGEAVLEWTISMPAGRLDAGRRQEFRTVVSDPPPEAVEVEVVLMEMPAHGNAVQDGHGDGAGHAPEHGHGAEAGAPAHDAADDHAQPDAEDTEAAHGAPADTHAAAEPVPTDHH
ncbi:DUF3426 domain-containing protein [Maricaulis maris]|jgi:predicted Zn finger-like uncharacterized protein|uniref:MJ0042 family finger-like protein n=1 Tax=Maricaulis maris (strain MCS10) TaxID=394221 RepID=Q0AM28_MARMM|nr:DUF3426 domain-containing protein [Maricaulis maris]ABI66665.1 MJ0042 family finger-like protein [Maricaulis maris MCS10]